jgi:hypothetical protein
MDPVCVYQGAPGLFVGQLLRVGVGGSGEDRSLFERNRGTLGFFVDGAGWIPLTHTLGDQFVE